MSGRNVFPRPSDRPSVSDRALTLLNESQVITRRRIFSIRTLDDIGVLLENLKRERFMGRVKFNLGPGGTVMDVELEESARIRTET